MQAKAILQKLRSFADPQNVAGMARFGIRPKNIYGVSIPQIRKIAKEIGKDHQLALQLWDSGIHEAKILAGFIDDPKMVTEKQLEDWVRDFDSWDVCDQICGSLFDKTNFALSKASEWSRRKEEFIKRAGFSLMAWLAVHDKEVPNKQFEKFLVIIKRESLDERNFVKKAINWALRQIGKRNPILNKKAISIAKEIKQIDSKSARWIANDAIRELASEKIQQKLNK